MITINYLIEKKYPVNHVLTQEDKKQLIKENEAADFSYQCLLKEMLFYENRTVEDLLRGWGGIKLVKFDD